MNQLSAQTLAQIVSSNHRTASVFEKYNLDFCCKGKRSLEQACNDQNIQVEELLKELETVSASGNAEAFPFDILSLTQLTDYIVSTHHSYVKGEMPQLLGYLEKIASKHGPRHPELYKIFELFAAVKEEMDMHMHKEEIILFPRIKELEGLSQQDKNGFRPNITYLSGPINVMEEEHDHAGSALQEIRQLTNNYQAPLDACTTYKVAFASLKTFEEDLHRHVHLENNLLFPKAISLLEKMTATSLN